VQIDFNHVSEQLVAFSLLMPFIFFFIKRLIDIRDRSESDLRSQLRELFLQLKELETRLVIVSKDMKADYLLEKIEANTQDIDRLKRNVSRKNHWISNSLMKLHSRLHKLDKSDFSLSEIPGDD
jgi:DNA repair ATPase RecN